MKTAIITGASSGIGLSTSKKLIEFGYTVFGLARDFSKTKFDHNQFTQIVCDVSDLRNLELAVKEILEKADSVDVLVNNAGVGYFAPHEEIAVKHIEQMVKTNLLAPLILTRLLLRELKKSKGFIINIASITATKSSPMGGAYAATKAGLRHFGLSLFDEVRKSGVKVVNINPDITKTDFYETLNFKEHDDPESHLMPEEVASAVAMVLYQREGAVVSEITIRPQKHLIEKKKSDK